MNKFSILLLTVAMTLGSSAAMAAGSDDGNGTSNQAAAAGLDTGGAKQNLPPNNIDNSKINTGDATDNEKAPHPHHPAKHHHHHKKAATSESAPATDADSKTESTTH